MATIFPREEKAEYLFDKILENSQACERLMETFYESVESDGEYSGEVLPTEKFAKALFDAYKNKDLTAFLLAICQHSMFDLLRNAYLVPFRFNADGHTNPYILTDGSGNLLNDCKKAVPDKIYHKFQKVYAQNDDVKMYLAEGYRKRHCYDEVTMEVKDYRMGEQLGVLLVYELPDTIKMKETEAQSYVAVMDLVMQLQEELPKSIVYYGQERLEEKGEHFDELGVFLPFTHFSERLEKHIETAKKIVYQYKE